MKKWTLIAIILLFNLGCSQIKEKHITEVSQSELEGVILVDVRTRPFTYIVEVAGEVPMRPSIWIHWDIKMCIT